MLGISIDAGMVNTEKEKSFNYGSDLKIGYTPIQDTSIYLIGSGLSQDFNNQTNYGFGYGVGAEYKISTHFATDIEYKKYSMTTKYSNNYDFDSTQIALKYLF
jgi:opacity protein-like surface antigen